MFRPMNFIRSLIYLNLILLVACSGGTGGTGATSGGGNVVVGTITQVNTASATAVQTASTTQAVAAAAAAGGNTVTINGVQFDVSSSAITLDGLSGTEADLRVGMVATVKGTVDANGTTGIADSLSVKEVIKGPVTNIDTANNTITVLGQIIQVTATTHWNNVIDITGIAVDNIVEVSGFVKNNNVIAATRVELLNANEKDFKVTGSITNLITATSTFNLGALVVDYSQAVLSNIPNNTPADGMYVEVKGTLANNQLAATQVNSEKLEISDADSMELQGFVTGVTSATSFSVNHQPVKIDGNTIYSGGRAADIVTGVLVDITGPLVNGILIANHVSFEDAVRITAVIDTTGANTFTLTGLGTLSVSADASTEFDDTVSSIADLMAGYTVTIHGNLIPTTNNIVATQITLESTTANNNVSLQGPVDAIAGDYFSVTILGINIDISLFPENSFIVDSAIINSKSYFFSLVNVGSVVTAQGTLGGSAVTWQSLFYEDPNN